MSSLRVRTDTPGTLNKGCLNFFAKSAALKIVLLHAAVGRMSVKGLSDSCF